MRLENKDGALVVELLHRVQQRLELARVMGVVIIHVCAVVLALELKAAAGAVEAGQAVFDGTGPDADADARGSRRKRIFHIVQAGHVQRHIREEAALIHDVKMRIRAFVLDVFRVDVRFRAKAKGYDLAVYSGESFHCVGIVVICHDVPVLRNALCESTERMLHIAKILEKVEVIGLYVENDGYRRMKREEGVIILTGLHYNGVAVTDSVPRFQERQRAAYHDGRVLLGRHQYVRAHGCGGGLAVGAGDAQRIAVVLRYCAPGLCALKHRDAKLVCADYLGIVVMHGSRAHDKLHVLRYILRPVADKYFYALSAQ